MRHPEAEELIEYEEGKLAQEKLRADLHGLRQDDKLRPCDALEEEIRRDNERLADEPVYREMTREMLTGFGMEKNEIVGPTLRLLNEFDERIARLRSERR